MLKPSEAIKFSRPLRAHQCEALNRFASENEMALFHDMGTGKTTTAIAWLRAKYNVAKEVLPTLIISPVATLYNWEAEFKINAPEKVCNEVLVPYMRTKKTKYTGRERAALIKSSGRRIIIMNPECLDMKEVVSQLKEFRPSIIIVDEAHRFKSYDLGPMSKPTRIGQLVQLGDRATHRAILTGTPILNGYIDLWAPCRFLDKGATFGTNFFSHFREKYFQDANLSWRGRSGYFPDWQPKPGIAKEISEKLAAKSSRLTKAECLDLPPLTFVRREVELSPDQAKAYLELENELITEISEGTCATVNALAKITRLLQILSGFIPVVNETVGRVVVSFKTNPRLEELSALLKELTPTHKVIVWASYRESYPHLRALCEALSLTFAEITGDIKDKRSEEMRFQTDPTCRVLIGNAQAGGVGINLTAASYAIYYSRNYSLGDRLQSEARCHRDGSQVHSAITIIDLVARNTLDDEVLSALLRKEQFSDNVLERIKGKNEVKEPA